MVERSKPASKVCLTVSIYIHVELSSKDNEKVHQKFLDSGCRRLTFFGLGCTLWALTEGAFCLNTDTS